MSSVPVYDVAIIGGGAVGCAIVHELTGRGLKTVLCEQNSQLVQEASAGNSGIVHTGFDATPSTIEHQCLEDARILNKTIYNKYNLPFEERGALLVAWNQDQMSKLPSLLKSAHNNGVTGARLISRADLLRREPHLNPAALGAMIIPGELVVDPWLIPITLAHKAWMQGSMIMRDCKVLGGHLETGSHWLLETSRGPIKSRVVINCTGLQGDLVEAINQPSPFEIHPRKGQFAVFDQSAANLLHSIILPVPTERTKGVLVFPSVYGNIVVGPTAEDQTARENPQVHPKVIDELVAYAHFVLPQLAEHPVVATYAGLRPATQTKDYHFIVDRDRGWVTVGGIRSTGLSACLAIARRVANAIPTSKPHITYPEQRPEIRRIADDTVEMDGVSYHLTHPLIRLGFPNKMAKL
ncbi:glycerol 3-phosphate dehydrogenase-like isoform X2 [Branchiostoma lanceolatum]